MLKIRHYSTVVRPECLYANEPHEKPVSYTHLLQVGASVELIKCLNVNGDFF